MKITSSYQFLGIVIVVIILISLMCSCTDVVPYTSANLFPKYYKYEGMQNLEYTSNTGHQAMDTYTSFLINNPNFECKKVYGFDGLYCKPYVADTKLDIFSDAQGGPNCSGTGLTNSKGGLCLDPIQMRLLTTRGGNASGGGGEIGK
jgi:hypothetical protein